MRYHIKRQSLNFVSVTWLRADQVKNIELMIRLKGYIYSCQMSFLLADDHELFCNTCNFLFNNLIKCSSSKLSAYKFVQNYALGSASKSANEAVFVAKWSPWTKVKALYFCNFGIEDVIGTVWSKHTQNYSETEAHNRSRFGF